MEKKFVKVFKGKNILVTGGTGSIGSEIVKNLSIYNPKVVRIFSNDEDSTYRLIQKIGRKGIRFLIGDIRDKERLIRAMEDIDIVYHAAALKHVPLCEYNPFEAIKTNVFGTQNVIEAALINGVEKVINISTDKAVNPVNTMGTTKLLAEKLITDANFYKGRSKTLFSTVRFGNVLFSRGSVLPLFEEQIKNKKMITITDPNMTRFMMSIKHTIDLVFKTTIMAKGGEIFILKMPVVKLDDLADASIKHYSKIFGFQISDIKKKIIGSRPGEKIFEELMTENEAKNAIETDDLLIIPPYSSFRNNIKLSDYEKGRRSKLNSYISKNNKQLSMSKIEKLLFM
jgi:UDP-N-acetylglucosamine 4,6-dehydratase/5-epimerase